MLKGGNKKILTARPRGVKLSIVTAWWKEEKKKFLLRMESNESIDYDGVVEGVKRKMLTAGWKEEKASITTAWWRERKYRL